MVVIQPIVFLILVVVMRRLFRVNRMVAVLESIEESLRQLPAVRPYDNSGQRFAAV